MTGIELSPCPLEEQYALIIRYLESLILERVPRLPFVPEPQGLRDAEVAKMFVGAARIAARQMGVR